MRRGFASAVRAIGLLCLLAATARANPPTAVITGPTGGVAGDILLLDASGSGAEFYAWSVTPRLPGERPTILPLEEGRKCLIASVPGKYHVFMACGNGEGIDQIEWTVTISEESSPEPAPPEPQPPQPSPVPDGLFGISKLAFELAGSVVSPNRAAEARALATAAETVAATIAAGAVSSPQEILQALLAANNAAVGQAIPAWTPWGAAIGLKLRELYHAGRLKTAADWSACLREIAIGLQAVK